MKLDNYQKAMWITAIVGTILLLFNINYEKPFQTGTFLDESVISLMAFLMLIITAQMQNRDLRLQRKEMELQREQFEESKVALEQQKDEMIESNKLIIQSNKQTQFYEMLRLKEDLTMKLEHNYYSIYKNNCKKIINEIIDRFPDDNITRLIESYSNNVGRYETQKPFLNGAKFDKNSKEIKKEIITFQNLRYISRDKQIYDILNSLYNESYEKVRNEMPIEYFKISKYNKLIEQLIENKKVKGILEKNIDVAMAPFNSMMSQIQNSMGLSYIKPELKLNDIYNQLSINDEERFYILVDGELSFNEFISNDKL